MQSSHVLYQYCLSVAETLFAESMSSFQRDFGGDLWTIQTSGTIREATADLFVRVREFIGDEAKVRVLSPAMALISAPNILVGLNIATSRSDGNVWAAASRTFHATVTGECAAVRRFSDNAGSVLGLVVTPAVEWYYMANGQMKTTAIFPPLPHAMLPSFYPFLPEGDPEKFIDAFLASSSNVLILRGEPGTGKTSFIQNLIWRTKTGAVLTYEKELFHADQMFVDFVSSKSNNLMILEDADALLSERTTGNTVMVKFLNISDGILRFPDKKIIITTNLDDETRIDPALLRPGRCFAAPLFRALTSDEARIAALDIGVHPDCVTRPLTLAQLFALKNAQSIDTPALRRVGFTI